MHTLVGRRIKDLIDGKIYVLKDPNEREYGPGTKRAGSKYFMVFDKQKGKISNLSINKNTFKNYVILEYPFGDNVDEEATKILHAYTCKLN